MKYNFIIGFTIFCFAFVGCNRTTETTTDDIFIKGNIYNIINKEIVLSDDFAGQSLTLVFEDNNYYLYSFKVGLLINII